MITGDVAIHDGLTLAFVLQHATGSSCLYLSSMSRIMHDYEILFSTVRFFIIIPR